MAAAAPFSSGQHCLCVTETRFEREPQELQSAMEEGARRCLPSPGMGRPGPPCPGPSAGTMPPRRHSWQRSGGVRPGPTAVGYSALAPKPHGCRNPNLPSVHVCFAPYAHALFFPTPPRFSKRVLNPDGYCHFLPDPDRLSSSGALPGHWRATVLLLPLERTIKRLKSAQRGGLKV